MTGSSLFTHQLSLLIILLNPLVTDYVVAFLITSMKRSYSKLYSSFSLFSFMSICILSWESFKGVIGVILYSPCSLRWVSLNFKDAFGLLKVKPILKYSFPEYYILVFWERQDSHSWGAKILNSFDGNYGSQWSKSPPNLLLSLKSLKAHCSSWVYPLEKLLHICTEDMYQNVHFSIISNSKKL